VDARHQGDRRLEQLSYRISEPLRGELHLAELVDQRHAAGPALERRQRDPLERLEIDAVATHPGRSPQVAVSQRRAVALERLDREAHAASALAELLGRKPRDRHARLAQQGGQAPEGRGLAGPRPRFDQQPGRHRSTVARPAAVGPPR
jgi:hypothetical protein